MTHDIQDLLDLIKELEERIIKLEKHSIDCGTHGLGEACCDGWYWDH